MNDNNPIKSRDSMFEIIDRPDRALLEWLGVDGTVPYDQAVLNAWGDGLPEMKEAA